MPRHMVVFLSKAGPFKWSQVILSQHLVQIPVTVFVTTTSMMPSCLTLRLVKVRVHKARFVPDSVNDKLDSFQFL